MSRSATSRPGSGSPDPLLDLAAGSSPRLARVLGPGGDEPLAAVVDRLPAPAAAPLQPRADLWEAVKQVATAGHGAALAGVAAAELRADPLVPTSNHFGIDTFADSFHGTVLFAGRHLPDGTARRTALVLGCASVSLENLTYPMGLLLYDAPGGVFPGRPARAALLGNRVRRRPVAAAPPLTAAGVARAAARLRTAHDRGELTRTALDGADEVLHDVVAPAVEEHSSYAMQATAVNRALWRRALPSSAPELVQVELERVCAALAARDLLDEQSLLHRLVVDGMVRAELLARLDGVPACWNLAELARRASGSAERGPGRSGTVLFWGLSPTGTRVPLLLGGDGAGLRLVGRDDRGDLHEWAATPAALLDALASRTLLPSLPTCFTVLAFARGTTCLGGYYQADYLPIMRASVAAAIGVQDPSAAAAVAAVPARAYLASLQFAARRVGVHAVPVGPVELAAVGGLSAEQYGCIGAVPAREAAITALMEVLPHVVDARALPTEWASRMGRTAAQNPTVLHAGTRDRITSGPG